MEHHLVMASGVARFFFSQNKNRRNIQQKNETSGGWTNFSTEKLDGKWLEWYTRHRWRNRTLIPFEKNKLELPNWKSIDVYFSHGSVPPQISQFSQKPCRISQYSDVYTFLKYLHVSSTIFRWFFSVLVHLLYQGTVWTASHSISYQPHHCLGAQQKLPSWLGSISAVMWISCGLVMTTKVISDLFM